MKEISLTQDKVALVDNKDFKRLSQWKWYFHKGYAIRSVKNAGKCTKVWMHREILAIDKGMFGDHKNGNTLDNRRSNLRSCTQSQNMRNRKKQRNNTSGFVGVVLRERNTRKKWEAQIKISRKLMSLGFFEKIEDAADVYKKAALQYHGEFVRR